jgi:hypothetical protein
LGRTVALRKVALKEPIAQSADYTRWWKIVSIFGESAAFSGDTSLRRIETPSLTRGGSATARPRDHY